MAVAFKIIKKSDFKKDKISGSTYTVAYKGRLLMVSTLSFEKDELIVKGDVMTISVAIEVIKGGFDDNGSPYPNKVMPKMDLDFGDF